MDEIETLNIEGQTYAFKTLTNDVKQLVSIYKRWNLELSDLKIEQAKLEAALRNVSGEMIQLLKSSNAEPISK